MTYSSFIDNKFQKPQGKTVTLFSPETNEALDSFNSADLSMVKAAVLSAKTAFTAWAKTPYKQRKEILLKTAALITKNEQKIVEMMVNFVAKNIKDSTAEVKRAVAFLNDLLEVYEQSFLQPFKIDQTVHHIKGKTGYFYHQPLGVVAAISPFNYPILTPLTKIFPALLTGNTVVAKSSKQTTIIGLFINELFAQAELPSGVFNTLAVTGSELGDELFVNPDIAMISFTGSTAVGKQILKQAVGKRLVLELGGKDAAIVLKDADLELAANEIIKGAFSYSGQRCTAIKRVLVEKSVHDSLVALLKTKIEKLTVGLASKNADITALVEQAAIVKNQKMFADALKKGAVILTGATVKDNLMFPTLIDKVDNTMEVALQEQFAPVLPVLEFDTIESAITLHNASNYGLQASVFCANKQTALDLFNYLSVGTVNWNRASARGPDFFPFLGIKDSGFGVQGIAESIRSMTTLKGFIENF